MEIKLRVENGVRVAVVGGDEKLTDVQSVLDLMATVHYQHDAVRVAIDMRALPDGFFVLRTGVAGEILQKFVNYGVKLAVFGDFLGFTSGPLRDFMRESNEGNSVFFVRTEDDAIARLARA